MVARDYGEGRMKRCLMDIEFQFWKPKKKFWRLDVQQSMCMNILMNCTLKMVKIVNFISVLCVCICAQLCLTLCDPMDLPGSSVHEIFQARILEWIAISSSRGSSQSRDQNCISCISCIDRQTF